MVLGFILAQVWLVSAAVGIDSNEKLGPCIPDFWVEDGRYLTAHEGVWFPQYRNRQLLNKRFSCHTLNERMGYVNDKDGINVDSWYSKDNMPVREKYTQSYNHRKWGELVDEEDLSGYGPYEVMNYIIKLTPTYRVRYVCTNMSKARKKDGPVVYIETRNMTPSIDVIREAVADIRKAGISVVLDKINQKGCTRPLTPDGYPDTDFDKK